jgi:hypothetical protein
MRGERTQLAEESGVLSGWKDIANYLRKGVRTVQRYEHELNLPVHRLSRGKFGGGVITTRNELDTWIQAETITNHESTKLNLRNDTFDSLKLEFARMQRNIEALMQARKALQSTVATLQMTVQECHLNRLIKIVPSSEKRVD